MAEEMGRSFNFTVKALNKLEAPAVGKQVYYADTQEKYLRLSVGKTGLKSFVFYKKVDGFPRRLTLGPYPALSIEQARTMVATLRQRLASGENPFDTGIKSRAEQTVEDLFRDYIENHAKQKAKTWQVIEKDFARNIGPLKRKRAVAVSSADARRLHSDLKRSRGSYTANRTTQLMRAVFNKATKHGLFEGPNPFTNVDLEPEQPRDRFLSSAEIQRLLSALDLVDKESAGDKYPYFKDFILMSLLTGQRRANVLAMHFNDIDCDQMIWTIGAGETKSKSRYVVALGPREIELILRRKRVLGGGYVFPGEGKTGHIVEPKRAWTSLRMIVLGDSSDEGKKLGALKLKTDEGFTLHDLRRSLGAALASSNVNVALIKGALNHKDSKTTLKHYAHSNKQAERDVKQMVQAEWFDSAVETVAKVVPLKRRS